MVGLIITLGTVLVACWWIAGCRPHAARDRLRWPPGLLDAELLWSEKRFSCSSPTPLVVRVDRVYRRSDGQMIVVEFKRRDETKAYLSDRVQLSLQRYVLERLGNSVCRHGYVIVIGDSLRPLGSIRVALEDRVKVEERIARLRAIRAGWMQPNAAGSPKLCMSCSFSNVCRRRYGSQES